MKVAIFDIHSFEQQALEAENKKFGHNLTFFRNRLNEDSVNLAQGHEAVCNFVNDHLNAAVLQKLKDLGIKLIALRSAGFNHVDMSAARKLGIPVVRVPEYSPYAVAEHAVALILTLNRKVHRSYARVREFNFSLEDLVGFDLHGKTVGIIGTGNIGKVLAKIMSGFGCRILANDLHCDHNLEKNLNLTYTDLATIYKESDIISLHVPLTPQTHHMINADAIRAMKSGVMLINTGRGALVDTKELISALKSGKVGFAGLDVYEEEEAVFFQDMSVRGIDDDVLARLLTFPNVLVTSHQAFLTKEALSNIANTTLENLQQFERGQKLVNQI